MDTSFSYSSYAKMILISQIYLRCIGMMYKVKKSWDYIANL